MRGSRYALVLQLAGLLGFGGCTGGEKPEEKPPAHVGVLIGGAGTRSGALRPVYDWAIAAVNKAGGAGGRRLEARYFELTNEIAASTPAQEALAAQMLSDPNLVAAVGAFSFAAAPKFVAAKVPYVTPESGAAEIFRAFHTGGYVWRTLESDSTLLWFLLAEAKGRGAMLGQVATSVGLLTSTDGYGETFFDWFGFHAVELGLKPLSPVHYDNDAQTCEGAVDAVLEQGTPDFLVVAPGGSDPVKQAACVVRTMKARGAASQMLFSDTVHDQALITALGADAEGLVLFSAGPDPLGGFREAFVAHTGLAAPPDHAANVLDAIALVAHGLEASKGVGGQALEQGMRSVVDGEGPPTRWDQFGEAQRLIREGQAPNISGASGPLSFDRQFYTDPTASFYDRWVVKGGAFVTTHQVTTESEGSPNVYSRSAVARGLKSLGPQVMSSGGGTPNLPPLQENWALIIATSATWKNYRHQADALAHYQALKANGFDDEHIVLATVDDLADATENKRKGEVINIEGGADVRAGSLSDYRGVSLTPVQLMTVLEGGDDPSVPHVLRSTAADNIYVMMVGHGGLEGPYLGMNARAVDEVDENQYLPPELLASTIARMKQNGKFRRMLIAVEACHSGVLAPALEALNVPDVILFASAASAESSFSANYSSQLQSWTADEFAFRLLDKVRKPALSIDNLYTHLYQEVTGSHVQIVNQTRFGQGASIQLSEFVTRRGP